VDLWLWAVPLVSAGIGYVTNWVAIRMLFRPHEEKRVLNVRVPFTPGLIPRRRDDLARSIGRSVRRYLLTQEAVSARLHAPPVRAQIDAVIEDTADRWLRRELPSVNALVPAGLRDEWGGWVEGFKARLDGWVEGLLAHPHVDRIIREQSEERLSAWLDEPLEDLLPADLADELPERLGDLLGRLIESEDLESRIDGFLERHLDRMIEEDRALGELIPERLREVAYDKLEDAVPLILDRFVKILEDDEVRKRIKIQLFELVDELLDKTFKEDSVWDQFKLGLMESFVITPEQIKQRIEDGIEQAGPRIAELVRRDDVRQKVYRALVDSLENFLNRPISEFRVEPETLDDFRARLSGWVASLLRSEALHEHLVRLVRDQLDKYRGRSLRQLLPNFSDETVRRTAERASERLLAWLRGPTVRAQVVSFVSTQVDRWLDRPLGRLDRFVPDEGVERAQTLAGDQLVALLSRETPRILESLNVEELVRDQVSAFSLQEVERLVVGITGNQLRAITWFGAVLGFLIGLFQVGLLLLGR